MQHVPETDTLCRIVARRASGQPLMTQPLLDPHRRRPIALIYMPGMDLPFIGVHGPTICYAGGVTKAVDNLALAGIL